MKTIDVSKFEKVKDLAKENYQKVGKIFCPYLNKTVHLNSEGFDHLLSKSWNKGRSLIEQYTRLRLLTVAFDIIKTSYTLQEYDERFIPVRQKINSRWEKRPKKVKYYVFVALARNKQARFKIVIKEIEGAQPFFWSFYPSWKVTSDGNGGKKKILYSGNLEED